MKFIATILVLVAIVGSLFVSFYNKIPRLDETVTEKISQVYNQYKRRADLIPNLIKVVKGYATHEKQTFVDVVDARNKAVNAKFDQNTLADKTKMQEFIAAQNALSKAISNLNITLEAYPELKSDKNFLALQSQLEGTENRISVARKDLIVAIKEFNLALKVIPTSFIAKIFFADLKPKVAFSVEESDKEMPKIEF